MRATRIRPNGSARRDVMANEPFYMEWDYFMQGFRLHQRAGKAANGEAQRMLTTAIDIAGNHNRQIPRAFGLRSFSRITAWLNGWIDKPDAEAMLAGAKADIGRLAALGVDQAAL